MLDSLDMNAGLDLAEVAALIGEPARAAMLFGLLHQHALTAGELSRIAGVSPQATSNHLNRLLEGGLVQVSPTGRHRYYQLKGPLVAQALEALAALAPPSRVVRKICQDEGLCFARSCYDHLAGELGVKLCQSFLREGWLEPTAKGFELTRAGEHQMHLLGLRPEAWAHVDPTAKNCMDWTERQSHIGGVLGRLLFKHMLDQHWISRSAQGRTVSLTVLGRMEFVRVLRVHL